MAAGILTTVKCRAAANVKSLVKNPKNLLPVAILAALLGLLSIRALVDELGYEVGARNWSMFLAPDDRFADLVKAGMSYLTPAMVDKADFATWPDLFKTYLVDNPNFGPMRYNLHLLPVANLLLMSAAKLILLAGPAQTLLLYSLIYIASAIALARFFAKTMAVSALDASVFAFAMIASYPALFMLTRSNFNSGFTSLLVCAYVLSVISGKWRWPGWFAFALALNMRPNTAVLAGIELLAAANLWQAMRYAVIPALLSLVVFGASYLLLHLIYPIYTIPNMLDGLRTYSATYIHQTSGADFNLSVFGADRFLRSIWGIGPYYSHTAVYLIWALALAMGAATVKLITLGRLSRIATVFLFVAFCVMFTPVFTLYHMVEFAAVLPLILQENRKAGILPNHGTGLVLAVSVLAMSPLGDPRVNGVICSALLLYGTITILYQGLHPEKSVPA